MDPIRMHGKARISLWAALAVLATGFATAELGPAVGPDKKIIKCGWDMPDTAYVRANIALMETRSLDGIVIMPSITIGGKTGRMEFCWWGNRPFAYEEVRHIAADMQATTFTRFTDNFLFMASFAGGIWYRDPNHPKGGTSEPSITGNIGWFDADDVYDTLLRNMSLAARISKESGLKGIFLDCEQYGDFKGAWSAPWWYGNAVKQGGTHTFTQCVAQVRRRGKQIAEAMCREYPDITVILHPGTHHAAYAKIWDAKVGLASSDYALLPAFVDGLLEGVSPGATIVDGMTAYPSNYPEEFAEYRSAFDAAGIHSDVPDRYPRLKLAYGLMLDCNWLWSRAKPFRVNHFTPGDWEHALYYALRESDRYVWLWMEAAVFWPNSGVHGPVDSPVTVPDEYFAALADCKAPHDMDYMRDDRGASRYAKATWTDDFESYPSGEIDPNLVEARRADVVYDAKGLSIPWEDVDTCNVEAGMGYGGSKGIGFTTWTHDSRAWRRTHPDGRVLAARIYLKEVASRAVVALSTDKTASLGYPYGLARLNSDNVQIYAQGLSPGAGVQGCGAYMGLEFRDYENGALKGVDCETSEFVVRMDTWYDIRLTLNDDGTARGEFKKSSSPTWYGIGNDSVDIRAGAGFAANYVYIGGHRGAVVDDVGFRQKTEPGP